MVSNLERFWFEFTISSMLAYHWPQRWPEINLNKNTFSSHLDNNQKKDLIECFYEQEKAITKEHPHAAYQMRGQRCTLGILRDYFGKDPKHIKAAVRLSAEYAEYKTYAEERRRPPPPPEMPRVDKCAELDRTSQVDVGAVGRAPILSGLASAAPFGAAAGTKRAAPDPEPDGAGTPGALPGAVTRARNCNVASLNGKSPVPPPQSHGQPLLPVITLALRGIDAAAANSRCRRGADEDS